MAKKFVKYPIKASKKVVASISYMDAFDEGLFDIEMDLLQELGVYLDTSSVRGGAGDAMFFNDPEGLNSDCDTWCGSWDDLITQLEWEDFEHLVETKVLAYPKSEWESRYRQLLLSILDR